MVKKKQRPSIIMCLDEPPTVYRLAPLERYIVLLNGIKYWQCEILAKVGLGIVEEMNIYHGGPLWLKTGAPDVILPWLLVSYNPVRWDIDSPKYLELVDWK